MIPVQPVFSKTYFKKTTQTLPKGISSQIYLSWEDGLWDLLRSFSIKKNAVILVPSFFCIDVIHNMQEHGLKAIYYEVDNNLQPNREELLAKIKQYNATLVVLFHPVGISNKLVTEDFIQTLGNKIFIIEDCVHRATNPSEIKIYSERHVLVNSFRKVVPLQGSLIVGRTNLISQLYGSNNTLFYSWSVIFLWILMQCSFINQTYIFNKFGLLAEWFMLKGYDLIGNIQNSGYCPHFFGKLYYQLDFNKIKRTKVEQVTIYKSHLNKDNNYYVPFFSKEDEKELRGFPIIIKKSLEKHIISYIRSKGIYIRAELNDSVWSKNRTIFYLPLGLHLDQNRIKHIASVMNQAIMNI